MATRSRIGILWLDDSVTSIYCHWDGYPEHNGVILKEHYSNADKLKQLMDLGNISVLGPEIGEKQDFNAPTDGWCFAYGRDRDETDNFAVNHNDIEDFLDIGEEYNYLYDVQFGTWRCYDGKTEIKLDKVLEAA